MAALLGRSSSVWRATLMPILQCTSSFYYPGRVSPGTPRVTRRLGERAAVGGGDLDAHRSPTICIAAVRFSDPAGARERGGPRPARRPPPANRRTPCPPAAPPPPPRG